MSEIPKKEVDFEGKVFIFHGAFTLPLLSDFTGYCNTAAPCQKKQIAQACLLICSKLMKTCNDLLAQMLDL